MNKNAYEIRLDILMDAHRYCTELFQHKASAFMAAAEKDNKVVSPEAIEKLYPSKKEIISTAEMFYEFVGGSHK